MHVSPSPSLASAIPLRDSFCVQKFGSGTNFSTLKGWNCRDVPELQICRLKLWSVCRGKVRVRIRDSSFVTRSSSGEGSSAGVDESGTDAVLWLRENLPMQLEEDGIDVERSQRIAEACADACAAFLATGRAFDPMMIMDAMEEEIERRDLRGDEFLPFELGRKAAKVLTQKWNELPVLERPKTYRQQAYFNKKDVVDFDKWPKNMNLP